MKRLVEILYLAGGGALEEVNVSYCLNFFFSQQKLLIPYS